jgi:Protein of unknown function (DUF3800)
MKVLFLDESGDHSLAKIDPQYPLFVLGGIIVDRDYAKGEMTERVHTFKRSHLGREDLVLHTADLTRNRNGFERMQDAGFRADFYAGLNQLMRELEYQVVACVIHKAHHLDKYDVSALDPYFLSLQILVERLCFEVGSVPDGGFIVAEKRGPPLDNHIELAWLNLKVQGTRFMRASQIGRRIQGLALRDKTAGIAALEIADLVVTPIGRFVQGKPVREDFRIIESKFRRDALGNYLGSGLVVLPRK